MRGRRRRSEKKEKKKNHLDRHAVGVGAKGSSRRAGVGNGAGAGFTDVDLRGRDMKLPTRNLKQSSFIILTFYSL